MDIKSSQKKVDVWIKKYGVRYFDIMTNMAILTEEVGEVARVISREYGEQSKKKQDESLKLSEEKTRLHLHRIWTMEILLL